MSLEFSTYSYVYLAATLVCIVGFAFAWRRRNAPGGTWLSAMLMAMIVWTLADMMDASSTQLDAHVFWGKASYLGSALVPALALLFAIEYTNRSRRPGANTIAALMVLPAGVTKGTGLFETLGTAVWSFSYDGETTAPYPCV